MYPSVNDKNTQLETEKSKSKEDVGYIKDSLSVLSTLQLWDKVFIEKTGIIKSDPWTYWQPLSRMLYNWYYGGADRLQLISFLENIYENVELKSLKAIDVLKQLYIKNNIRIYGVVSDTTRTHLEVIESLNELLPESLKGLHKLQVTYSHDNYMQEKLKDITLRYQTLTEKIKAFVDENRFISNTKEGNGSLGIKITTRGSSN